MRGQNSFKQRDATRLLKAGRNAGMKRPVVEIELRTGIMRLVDQEAWSPSQPSTPAESDPSWE